MNTGLLHLHNILRWIILVLLLISLVQAFTKKEGLKKTSLFLMIAAHITLLIGLYQWYFSSTVGLKTLLDNMGNFGAIMKNGFARFWAVEHIAGMLIAIVLITIARGKAKKGIYSAASWLYLIALIAILVSIPWPFRESVGRPWFPGL
ncbi:MAG TPA: hypothetical protein VFN30_03875 [Chitinophagaceae bacterium]|nr:hypothetical protein [Chitinophagaceae bacterium]